MAQNIDLLGAQYSDVPAVTLPKVGGGTASFTDVTGTTAIAGDVAQGKYFFTANGTLTLGTNQGGGGYVTQDENGYIVLPSTGGGGGGSGLEYETGTWIPSEDISRGTITFTNAHTTPPLFIMLTDDTETSAPQYSNRAFSYVDHYRQVGHIIGNRYGYVGYMYATNDVDGTSSGTQILATSSDSGSDSSGTYSNYYAKATGFYPSSNSASRYWRANRTYKWIAVWAPTT